MKSNLLTYVLCLIGFVIVVNSDALAQQVIYNQDFQTETISSQELLIKKDSMFTRVSSLKLDTFGWDITKASDHPTNHFLRTSSDFINQTNPETEASRFFILPPIALLSNTVLQWNCRSSNISNLENYEVVLLDSALNPVASLFTEKAPYSAPGESWSIRQIDLQNFAGTTIRLAFVANGKNGSELHLDNVIVSRLLLRDAAFSETYTTKYVDSFPKVFFGKLINRGILPILSFEVKLWIEDTFFLVDYSGLNLQRNRDFNFSFPPILIPNKETYLVRYIISKVNGSIDEFQGNDTVEFRRVVVKNPVPRKVLVEKFTGTWCGHCPKGAVLLNRIMDTANYIVPVSIHQGDIMEIKEADSLIQFLQNGYPTASINRRNIIGAAKPGLTLGLWPSSIVAETQKVTPVKLKLENSLNEDKTELKIGIKVTFTTQVEGDFNLNFLITQHNVTGGQNYTQNNFAHTEEQWPELFGKGEFIAGYKHDYVLRKLPLGPWGKEGLLPSKPVKDSIYEFEFKIPWDSMLQQFQSIVVAYVSERNQNPGFSEILNTDWGKVDQILNVQKQRLNLNGIHVYPNPAKNEIHLKFLNEKSMNIVSILDLQGRIKMEMLLEKNEHSIDVSSLPKGMYLLKVQNKANRDVYYQKIIIDSY